MAEEPISILGETPELESNPSSHAEFCLWRPTLFAPLQTEAYRRVKMGKSCALLAPTSSGKTLAVAAPLFEAGRPAVFVLPFRALIQDQSQELVQIASVFGIGQDKFGTIWGGSTRKEISDTITECDYILTTPDKLISLFIAGRDGNSAALNILSKYDFVFDEIHVFNIMMQTSLRYFLRSVLYWQEIGRKKSGFYFLSATFPNEIRQMLKAEVGLEDDDFIEGLSYTGDITLTIKPVKENAELIARDIQTLDIETNMVGIFNSAYRAWQVSESIGGLLYIGQDKMSELQRRTNFQQFKEEPELWALIGSPAIEAGVDFVARNLVIEESHQDSFVQRFGRAARSGKDAIVLAYSDALYKMLKQEKIGETYTRAEFLTMLRDEIKIHEPTRLFAGLAVYPYFNFWNQDPNFPIEATEQELCKGLADQGVENFLAFRGLTPYTRYETGEFIGFKSLFRKQLPIAGKKVRGAPHPAKYFTTPNRRSPLLATILKVADSEQSSAGRVILAKVQFKELGTHWVLLEIARSTGVNDQDDNIRLEFGNNGCIGRNADGSLGQELVRFYDVDV